MALIPPVLWRGVLRLDTEPDSDLRANLTALRSEVRPQGLDAHLLGFLGDLTDKTGQVPTFDLLLQHYEHLQQTGDPQGMPGVIRLTDFRNMRLPFVPVTEYRYQLDRFKEETLADGLGVLLQQVGQLLTQGLQVPQPKGPAKALRGPYDAIRFMEQGLASVVSQFHSGDIEGSFWTDIPSVLTRYHQTVANPARRGVMSGHEIIDTAHGGLQPGDLALVLGFTGHLKSTFVLNWVYRAATRYGWNAAFLSLEMSAKALLDALVCIHAQHPMFSGRPGVLSVTYDKLRWGLLSAAELKLVEDVVQDLTTNKRYGQILYKEPDRSMTVADIRRWAEQQDQKVPLDLLAIDYLAFVNPSSGGSSMRESAIANEAVREVKTMAMTFRQGRGIPILSPFQSNREGFKEAEKSGGRYSLRALAWAPEAERSADLVYSLYRDATLAGINQLMVGNLKARDRRVITDLWNVFADPAIKVIEDIDMTKVYQRMVTTYAGQA